MIESTKGYAPKDKGRLFLKSGLFLAFIILFVVIVRVRLLDFPLERDEGEYAYMGQLLLQGVPPYSEAYNMKFPGTYLMYALIMAIFGQTAEGIHIGFMIVNSAAILLVYLLARKMVDDIPAAVAGGTYGLLSLSSSVFGFAAHATHFVVLPALGGTLLLLYALKKEKLRLYFLSGILLGISVIMKQPGVFFCLFGAAYLIYNHVTSRPAQPIGTFFPKLGAFLLGAALPLAITLIWLYAAGVFDKFWFWTVVYASRYASQISLSDAFSFFRHNFLAVANGFFLFWIISALGFITMFFHKGLKVNKVFVLLFAFFSFLSICPGFYFRRHYFITLLPAVALLVGIFIDFIRAGDFAFLKERFSRYLGAGIFIVAASVGVIHQKHYFFIDAPTSLSSSIYFGNPFPESIQIARFIQDRTAATDRIAVLGSEPQIFFYAKRPSATGHIYMYGLMEHHDYSLAMQKEMIHEVESSRPKFIVEVHVTASWLRRPESEQYIFDWIENYVEGSYVMVGIVDIISPDLTVYRWDEDVRNYTIQSPQYLLIYERKQVADISGFREVNPGLDGQLPGQKLQTSPAL